ncbi:EAL domain-containing protein [Deferribacter autotrophicus]|uniref:EAL domain-containing protein n=1 Tax=Deferribacter autotrophicus TaxID=500465 RepID=A0A5A8F3Y4_9BACT|nr:EAL domain-containing response regulator [Deferribacter autotrophicus]KAA0258236.1 EAL domain-containing protein [Deferribacter autotrophicus]
MNKDIRVFILEDDTLQFDIIKQVVENAGVNFIDGAYNGNNAIKKLKEHKSKGIKYDIIITDLNMPGMDGIKFLEEVNKYELANNAVVVSGMDSSILESVENLVTHYKIPVLGIVSKPFSSSAWYDLMENFKNGSLKRQKSDSCLNGKVEKSYSKEEILLGIKNKEFIPYFQPQINLLNERIDGFEALARWIHKEDGIVSPFKFIPIIESDMEIQFSFTMLMFDKVIEFMKLCQKINPDIYVSMNIFVNLLEDERFYDELIERVNNSGISPSHFVLEITESGLATNMDKVLSSLARFRLKGFKLSIDDFGTGYSSLAQLRAIPFTELKIDRVFIRNIHKNNKNQSIVLSTKLLAEKLGLSIVVEGCEIKEEIDYLKVSGCDTAQGFYYSKPLTFEEAIEYLKANL